MEERIILRTISNLSFAGEIIGNRLKTEKGILLKTSPKSNIKIWVPLEEIQVVIGMGGDAAEGDRLEREYID